MEDLLQYFDFSEVDSVTAKLAGMDTVSFSDLFGLFIKGDFTGAYKLLMQELGQLFFPGAEAQKTAPAPFSAREPTISSPQVQ